MKKNVLYIAIIIFNILLMSSCEVMNLDGTSGEGWTFMIYMAGDNTLSDYIDDDINEIEQGLYDSYHGGNSSLGKDIKVLVLEDQDGYKDTNIYLIQPDNNYNEIKSKRIVDSNYPENLELDMSKTETLTDFVSYSMGKCPSNHYALIIWNHGGGARSTYTLSKTSREFCEDDENYMFTNQFQKALYGILSEDATNPPLDIIGFDACLMGTLESAYEYRKLSSYYVGSQANEWGRGWDYTEIFNNFKKPDQPPSSAEMADILVEQYYESTKEYDSEGPHTMVAVNTSKLENLKNRIDNLAQLIYNNNSSTYKDTFEDLRDKTAYLLIDQTDTTTLISTPYYDLYDLCENMIKEFPFGTEVITAATSVKQALSDAIVACYGNSTTLVGYNYYKTSDTYANRGLSILIPNGEKTYNGNSYYDYISWYTSQELLSTYGREGGIDFCNYDNDQKVETWRELFEVWYAGAAAEY